LASLQDFLTATTNTLSPVLADKVADPTDAMVDFELDAKLGYVLREDDSEYREDSDNYLTEREESIKRQKDVYQLDGYGGSQLSDVDGMHSEAHCWLFHDLYDHSYGLTMPKVPLRDCLRLGKVWVDVVIRQQYLLNLDTGAWERWEEDGNAGATI